MTRVQRLTFLVHPGCYAPGLARPDRLSPAVWARYQAGEQAALQRWYQAIEAMDETDAMVYHPCYASALTEALLQAAQDRLGPRLVTVRGREVSHPDGIPPATLAALAPEITAAFRRRAPYSWSGHDLRMAIFSRHYAADLVAALRQHEVELDLARLELRAWGESFEGCVTTWTTMVPPYLGTPARVEIAYEMTVPDTAWLLDCTYVGRWPLADNTALYLFRDPQGHGVAHYKRERITLDEPSGYSRLDLPATALAVRDQHGRELLPAGGTLRPTVPVSLVRPAAGRLEFMVASGRGRGGEGPDAYPREGALFISAPSVPWEPFQQAARRAEMVPER